MSFDTLRELFQEQLERSENAKEAAVSSRHYPRPENGDGVFPNLANTYDPSVSTQLTPAYDGSEVIDFSGVPMTSAPLVQQLRKEAPTPSSSESIGVTSFEIGGSSQSNVNREKPVITVAGGGPTVNFTPSILENTSLVSPEDTVLQESLVPVDDLVEGLIEDARTSSSDDSLVRTIDSVAATVPPIIPSKRSMNDDVENVPASRQRTDYGGSTSLLGVTDTSLPSLTISQGIDLPSDVTRPEFLTMIRKSEELTLKLAEDLKFGVQAAEALVDKKDEEISHEKRRADEAEQRAEAAERRAAEAEQRAEAAVQRAVAAEQSAEAAGQRVAEAEQQVEAFRISSVNAEQQLERQRVQILSLSSSVHKLNDNNSELLSESHKLRAAFEDCLSARVVADINTLAIYDEAHQYQARLQVREDRLRDSEEKLRVSEEKLLVEVAGAKLVGAQEFKASKVYQTLLRRSVGNMATKAAELVIAQLKNKGHLLPHIGMSDVNLAGDEFGIVKEMSPEERAKFRASRPEPSNTYYSLLGDQAADVYIGSNTADSLLTEPSGTKGTDQNVLAGEHVPTTAELGSTEPTVRSLVPDPLSNPDDVMQEE